MLWRWGKLEFKSTWHYHGESKEQLCSCLPADLTCFKWSWRYFMLQDWSLLSTACFIKLDADCSRHDLWWLETQSAALAPDHCVQTELGRELRMYGRDSTDPWRNDPSPSGPMLSSHSSLACLGGTHSQGEAPALHLTLQNPLLTGPSQFGRKSQLLSGDQGIQETRRWEGGVREKLFLRYGSPKQIKPFQSLLKC